MGPKKDFRERWRAYQNFVARQQLIPFFYYQATSHHPGSRLTFLPLVPSLAALSSSSNCVDKVFLVSLNHIHFFSSALLQARRAQSLQHAGLLFICTIIGATHSSLSTTQLPT